MGATTTGALRNKTYRSAARTSPALLRGVHGLLVGRGKHIHRRALGHLLQQGARRQSSAAPLPGVAPRSCVSFESIGQADAADTTKVTRHGGTSNTGQNTQQGCAAKKITSMERALEWLEKEVYAYL